MGNNLKMLRKKANLTQNAAAEKLGVGQSTIAMWETDQCMPRMKMLNMEPVANISNDGIGGKNRRQQLTEIMGFLKNFKIIDRQNFGVIHIIEDDVNRSLNYLSTDNEYASFWAIPRVIKKGKILAWHENHKMRGHPTKTVMAPVIINGRRGNIGVVIKQTGKNRYKTHRIIMVDNIETSNKKETEATSGKMTDVATGESLPITTVSVDTMITRNKNSVNSNSMQKSKKDSKVERKSIDIDDIIDDPEKIKEVRLRNDLLKQQFQITDGTRRSVPKTRSFANRLLKEYESSYSYADLSDDLIQLYDYIGEHTGSSVVSQKTLQDITERANAVAKRIVDNEIKNYLKAYRKGSDPNTNYEQAEKEFVADFIGGILANEAGLKEFVDQVEQRADLTTAEKRDIIHSLIDLIRKALEKIEEFLGAGQVTGAVRAAAEVEADTARNMIRLLTDALDTSTETVSKINDGDTVTISGSEGTVRNSAGEKIRVNMSESDRAEILRKKKLILPIYEGQVDSIISKDDIDGKEKIVKAALMKIGEEFEVFTDYKIEDVDLQIYFSRSNLKETISKLITPNHIAKLLPVLKDTVENAIGIERHDNRYFYDSNTKSFENLIGGYVDKDYVVPVRFGLKHSKQGKATLYVIVDQEEIEIKKIKADTIKIPRSPKAKEHISSTAFTINLTQIIPFVKRKDLLRYLPDEMLDIEQRELKRKGIVETAQKTDKKNDKKYLEFLQKGNVRAMRDMVETAAKAAGYTEIWYHGTSDNWDTYDLSKINPHNAKYGNGIYLAKTPEAARLYGDIVKKFYVKPGLNHRDAKKTGGKKGHLLAKEGGKETGIMVVYDANQIKSADVVTYDDNDNVIPISKRFDNEKDDTRRSIDMDAFAKDDETAKEITLLKSYVKDLLEISGGGRKSIPRIRAFAERLVKQYKSTYSAQDLTAELINLYEYIGKQMKGKQTLTQEQQADAMVIVA